MTQITATIFPNAEEWLKENLRDFAVDGIAAVYPYPTYKFNADFGRTYFDEEEDKLKYATLNDHVAALKLLCELVDQKKLFVGGVTNAQELTDGCNWDVEVVDAYFQLIYHGEVIYG
jgi:hypothetical protein